MWLLFSFFLFQFIKAEIISDFNCTSFNGTSFVYTAAAVACDNIVADSSCEKLYVAAVVADGYPTVDGSAGRSFACYSTDTAAPASVVQDMKTIALSTCPKTCGFCCQTDAYRCSNAAFPRLNCNTITPAQCNSAAWRTIIANDCPAACGFCNEGGCVDAVTSCSNDISICNTVGMQDFVNANCQKTCSRCSSSPSSPTYSSSCSSYQPDSVKTCSQWAKNGFCTNPFYTNEVRKAKCATSCKIC